MPNATTNVSRQAAPASVPTLSIIVPLIDELQCLPELLDHLVASRPQQIILIDGGSTDGSWQWLQQYSSTASVTGHCEIIVQQSKPGRAAQMNAGALSADSELLLFLHADTRLPDNLMPQLAGPTSTASDWGRFDLQFDSRRKVMAVIAWFINWRSRLSGIATGDQAIFVRRKAFNSVGGFDPIPLMEDIALSRKLKSLNAPRCLTGPVTTSARRWQSNGVLRTVLLMWLFRLAFAVGVSPHRLAGYYTKVR